MHKLIAFLVSNTDTPQGDEQAVIRVCPIGGGHPLSVEITMTHHSGGKGSTFHVENGAEMLPGVFGSGHLLGLLLPLIFERFADAETYGEALADPIEFSAHPVSV